jgi:hypothetical protein
MVEILKRPITRRDFLGIGGLVAETVLLAACAAPARSQEAIPDANTPAATTEPTLTSPPPPTRSPFPTPPLAVTPDATKAALEKTVKEQAEFISAAQTREARPTNSPVPPTATLRATSTPPPTSTKVSPTATRPREQLVTATPTPSMSLLAAEYAADRWLWLLNAEQGQKASLVDTDGGDLFNPQMNYLDTEITERGKVNGRPFTALDIARGIVKPEDNYLKVRWTGEDYIVYPGKGPYWSKVSGEAELKDIKTKVTLQRELSSADRANGIEWDGAVEVQFIVRQRYRVRLSERYQDSILPPTSPMSAWKEGANKFTRRRVKGKWEGTPNQEVFYPFEALMYAAFRPTLPSNCPVGGDGCNLS